MFQVRPDDTALFSWLNKGELFFLDLGETKGGAYIYRSHAGRLSVVSGSKDDAASMVREEVPDNFVGEFISVKLAHVLFSVFAPHHSHIIHPSYLRARSRLPDSSWDGVQKEERNRALLILKKYEAEKSAVIERGTWVIEFHVALQNGSIEKWNAAGSVTPFSIDKVERTIVEPSGSVAPIPE